MDGFSVALDEYGGHDHDDYGYHYHAHAKAVSSTDKTGAVFNFTQHFMMVGAYKGNINSIPDFQNGGTNQLKDSELAKYVGLEGTYVTTSFDTSIPSYTVSVINPTGGSITGAGTYDSGSDATLTATADSGYIFSSWGGDASGSVNPLSLSVSQDLNITANFTADDLWSTSTSIGNGWYSLTDSFGLYFQNSTGWIYHIGMGWLYPVSISLDSTWLYKYGRGWLYLKISDYPFFWDDKDMNWIYYAEQNGQPSLYEYASGTWKLLD